MLRSYGNALNQHPHLFWGIFKDVNIRFESLANEKKGVGGTVCLKQGSAAGISSTRGCGSSSLRALLRHHTT